MIFCRLSSCGSLVPVDPPGNSLEPVTKKRFNSNTRPRDLFLTDCLNRSTQEKSFPNTGDACWRSNIEIGVEAGSSVTTNQLLLHRPPRKTVASLPISRPISNILSSKCNEIAEGAGGDQPSAVAESPISISSHGILFPIGLPYPVPLKKRASRPQRNSEPSLVRTFR